MFVCTSFVFATAKADGITGAPMRFNHLDTDDGLAQNSVMAMAQDAEGFLWFATENGLNRYDGNGFLHFQADVDDDNSLPADYVKALALTSSGEFWVATEGSGIARWNPAIAGFERVGLESGLTDLRVSSMVYDSAGYLWIGTLRHGLNRYDLETGKTLAFGHDAVNLESLSGDAVHVLHIDAAGTLWIGTDNGLDKIERGQRGVSRVAGQEKLGGATVRAILRDRAGNLWVGTRSAGLSRSDDAGQSFVRYTAGGAIGTLSNNRVEDILEDDSGRIWIATADGLNRYLPEFDGFSVQRANIEQDGALSDSNTISLYQDRGGLLWVGTKTAGVNQWNPRNWSFGHVVPHAESTDNPLLRRITSFADGDVASVWVGTFGAGLARVDRLGAVLAAYSSESEPSSRLTDDRVMSLLRHENDLWVGTMTGGLNHVNLDSGVTRAFTADPQQDGALANNGVMSLHRDQAGTLWVGTFGGGVDRFDVGTESFTNYSHDPADPTSLSNSRATAIIDDNSGRLWVGTGGGGLNRLAPDGQRWERIVLDPRREQDSTITVSALHVDATGRLWVGTREGLFRADTPSSPVDALEFRRYDDRHGLADDSIYGIRSDSAGRIWVSTNRGLSWLDPVSGEVFNHFAADGLQGAEFNFGAHVATADGRLAFGGANGFNWFDPMRLEINSQAPSIALTGLELLNEPVRASGVYDDVRSLSLGYEDDVVTFEFAALDFAAPEQNLFQYKLEGFDRDWVDAGTQHRTTYTNLDGGDYVFRVRAANSDGVWAERELSLSLDVEPPPWLTPWAFALYLLTAIGILTSVWHAQARKLRQRAEHSRQLEAEVAERTREIASRNRELELANAKLHEASYTDSLTGLRNRRYFFEQIGVELDRVARDSSAMTGEQGAFILMMIDLDHFKPVNDTHGHQAGDRLLVGLSESLTGLCRSTDTVIRWGGDEFMLVARRANAQEADELAERVRSVVASSVFPVSAGHLARTTSSIGYAPFPFYADAPHFVSWEQVLKIADTTMYVSKAQRNSWCGVTGNQKPESVDVLMTALSDDVAEAAEAGLVRMNESLRGAAERIA